MSKYSLTAQTAQLIADNIMQTIPNNINIMNGEGVIIASGQKNRIGTVHKGACIAIRQKKPYNITEDTETEKKGINLPIEFNGEIIGVIGISGEVDKVMPFGQILVATAKVMIENQIYNEMSAIKQGRKQDFLYEWSHLKKEAYVGSFLNKAEFYGIDLKKERIAVIIKLKVIRYSLIDDIKSVLDDDEYIIRQGMKDALILINTSASLNERLKKIYSLSTDIEACVVGRPSVIASETCDSAQRLFTLTSSLNKCRGIVYYHDYLLETLIQLDENYELNKEIISKLKEIDTDNVLIDTIFVFARYSNDIQECCRILHIHRNTLTYRLSKIEKNTGLNPHVMRDFGILYHASVKIKMAQYVQINK
jgi:carbohydrate diacid regulator